MTRVLIRERRGSLGPTGRRPCTEGGRDGSGASTAKVPGGLRGLEEPAMSRAVSVGRALSGRNPHGKHGDIRLLASRAGEDKILVG